jgi:Xaa-Pro aminopeptidase
VNAELAAAGVRDAGNSVIGSGPTAADLHYTGTAPIRGGETVLLDLSPRGPHGYYGDMTRTFVVDGDGGWERRAYIAVEAAREAALAEVEAGRSGLTVHQEAAAELAAHGFDPSASETEPGFTHGTGHGVGVSLHERPSLSADTELQAGHVVTVEPGVYDPAHGGVRLEDLIVVREDGYETLAAYPFGSTPTAR